MPRSFPAVSVPRGGARERVPVELSDIGVGLGFLLIVEGLPLFLSPARYRKLLAQIDRVPDRTLRASGFVAMAAGLVVLYALR